MSTYKEIQAQIEELKKQADAARANEIDNAKAQILDIMKSYDLTLADIASSFGRAKKKSVATVPPKYKDPQSGATWTGRGRAPLWLNGRSKEDFLIK